METEVQQETVTFYMTAGQRADKDGGCYPSSAIIRISGGERQMSKDGARFMAPMKEARFHNGTFQTDDSETIAMLRKLSLKDPNLTEDYEAYAQRTLTKDQRIARTGRQQEASMQENSRLKQKIAQLEGKKGRGLAPASDEVPE
jgi:hypothetical protein